MTLPHPRFSAHVRHSTDADMAAIHAWLEEQDRVGRAETLLCNWNLTEECHGEGSLLVYVDPATDAPVAYHWGALRNSGILEVRHDMRGRGIGKAMVEHCMALAEGVGQHVLKVECAPISSVPFWTRMGFERNQVHDAQKYVAVRLMHKKLDLPVNGDPVEVLVEWFHESKVHGAATSPVCTQRLGAVRQGAKVHLGDRAVYHAKIGEGDTAVRIVLDGVELCFCKAKYEEAQSLGVMRCDHGFFFETLTLPP